MIKVIEKLDPIVDNDIIKCFVFYTDTTNLIEFNGFKQEINTKNRLEDNIAVAYNICKQNSLNHKDHESLKINFGICGKNTIGRYTFFIDKNGELYSVSNDIVYDYSEYITDKILKLREKYFEILKEYAEKYFNIY